MEKTLTIFLVEHILMVGLILPMIIAGLNGKNNYKKIILFLLFHPDQFSKCYSGFLWIFKNYKWILALGWKNNFLIVFNNFHHRFLQTTERQLFFTVKQNKDSIKSTISAKIIILIVISVFTLISADKTKFNIETLAFQISLPALDEGFSYRGIMIGLLVPQLKNYFCIGKLKLGHPAIWITGILFGLVHGFTLTMNWQL